jgi:hypothetical protein
MVDLPTTEIIEPLNGAESFYPPRKRFIFSLPV